MLAARLIASGQGYPDITVIQASTGGFFFFLFSLFPDSFLTPLGISFFWPCSPTFQWQTLKAKDSTSCRSDAVSAMLFVGLPLHGSVTFSVKGSWKGFRLSQPAVSACPDQAPFGSTLPSPPRSFLAQIKCWFLHMVARERRAFSRGKMKQEDMEEWEKYQKVISWCFLYLPFSLHFLRCIMPLPKGKLATGS